MCLFACFPPRILHSSQRRGIYVCSTRPPSSCYRRRFNMFRMPLCVPVKTGSKFKPKAMAISMLFIHRGVQDGSMIIDLERFQEINLNAQFIVKVGLGVRLENLALDIHNQSKRVLPHGLPRRRFGWSCHTWRLWTCISGLGFDSGYYHRHGCGSGQWE